MSEKEKKKRKPESSKGEAKKQKPKKPKGEKKAPTPKSVTNKVVKAIMDDPTVEIDKKESTGVRDRLRAKILPLLMDFEVAVRKKG
jgi:hypothetical protein